MTDPQSTAEVGEAPRMNPIQVANLTQCLAAEGENHAWLTSDASELRLVCGRCGYDASARKVHEAWQEMERTIDEAPAPVVSVLANRYHRITQLIEADARRNGESTVSVPDDELQAIRQLLDAHRARADRATQPRGALMPLEIVARELAFIFEGMSYIVDLIEDDRATR